MICLYALMIFSLLDICSSSEELPRVLIISLDGFRYDYLRVAQKFGHETPNFNRMINEGVSIKDPGLTNVFITKTLPNHYSLVTGLYIESHGIVANSFFDPVFNETFNWESSMNIKWWNGTGEQKVEPIWVTNEAAGTLRSSGVYFWPGSDIIGQQPKHYRSSYKSPPIPFESRLNTMIDWFTQVRDPICFGALYMNEPDSSGHQFGPETSQVAQAIADIDRGIGQLLEKLESKQLLSKINIILTSDHGMALVAESNTIFLEQYVDPTLFKSFAGSPITHILPKTGHEDKVYRKLLQIPHITVYKKEEIPVEFHYSHSRRIMPIVIFAQLGYRICRTVANCDLTKGNHGWDNKEALMHPIFIARGPAFKKNYIADPFETINIYALQCCLLGINPRPNNGSLDAVRHILTTGWSCPTSSSGASSLIIGWNFWLAVVSAISLSHFTSHQFTLV